MQRLVFALLIGLAVGVGIGLFIGWVVSPVQTVQGPMSDLSRRYKDEYTVMVASAYQVDGDLTEALRRLKPLGLSLMELDLRFLGIVPISQHRRAKQTQYHVLLQP